MATEPNSTESTPSPGKPRKRISPAFAGFLFMILFMGFYLVAQMISAAGPQVQWMRDYDEALKTARSTNRRVFLLMYDPGCPINIDMDRSVFQHRWARDILSRMVACRIELTPADPLRGKFILRQSPTSVVLEPDGKPVREPHTGGYDERQFKTYVHPE